MRYYGEKRIIYISVGAYKKLSEGMLSRPRYLLVIVASFIDGFQLLLLKSRTEASSALWYSDVASRSVERIGWVDVSIK